MLRAENFPNLSIPVYYFESECGEDVIVSSCLQTSFVPEKEEYNLTKAQLLARMDVAMGGRVAEEVIYGQERVTTGQPPTHIGHGQSTHWPQLSALNYLKLNSCKFEIFINLMIGKGSLLQLFEANYVFGH